MNDAMFWLGDGAFCVAFAVTGGVPCPVMSTEGFPDDRDDRHAAEAADEIGSGLRGLVHLDLAKNGDGTWTLSGMKDADDVCDAQAAFGSAGLSEDAMCLLEYPLDRETGTILIDPSFMTGSDKSVMDAIVMAG